MYCSESQNFKACVAVKICYNFQSYALWTLASKLRVAFKTLGRNIFLISLTSDLKSLQPALACGPPWQGGAAGGAAAILGPAGGGAILGLGGPRSSQPTGGRQLAHFKLN